MPEVFSRYRVRGKLGRGGMGEVYLAEDPSLRRKVALKILPAALQEDPVRRQRFVREAQLAAGVDHPYVCKIYEAGEFDGVAFIAMEFIDGISLAEQLRSGPLGLSEALRICIEVTEALARAHEAGIIHRDLKPSNVMLTRDAHVKVVDFGLARHFELSEEQNATETLLSNPGFISGTLAYMSPEQCRGCSLDQRSDIFSLGIIFYEMLTGTHPFRRHSPLETAIAIMHDQAPAIVTGSHCPIGVQQVVQRMLAKSVEFRYQTVSELILALRAVSAKPHESLSDIRPLGPSIAVLPFANHSGDKENDYLSDGMTEEIIVRLAKISSLRVIALRSVLHFKNSDKTLEQIGQELGVGTVLEGSIRFFQGRIRILVGLVDVSNLSQLWAETYDLRAADIFDVQKEVAEQIASALRARFPAGLSDSSLASVRLPDNLEAYHLYLKGRHAMGHISPEGFRSAIQLFRRALDLDATYARSYAGLGLCYAMSGHLSFMPPKEAFTLAKAAAAKALEFQETLSDAHLAMALVYLWYEWRWDEAERELRSAATLSPNDPDAHLLQSIYWIIQGQWERAVREARRAMDLDPLSPRVSAMVGWVLCFAGQIDEGAAQLQRTLDLDPGYIVAQALLGEIHLLKGNFEKAIEIFEPWPWAKSHLATARALSGDTETAHKMLAEIKAPAQAGYQSHYDIGMLCLALDLLEEGFDNLDESFDERDPKLVFLRPVVEVTPHLQFLRQHPRYLRLVEKIGYRPAAN